MSKRNKLENKSLRRRERKDHVPNICLSAPGNASNKAAKKLQGRSLEQIFTLFKRSIRRLKRAEQLIAKLPANKVSGMLDRIVAHCKWIAMLALAELERREKLLVCSPAK